MARCIQAELAAPAPRRRGRGGAAKSKASPPADDDAASSLAGSLATPAPNSRATRSTRARAAASAEPLTSLRSPPRTRARAGRLGRGAAASATPAEPIEQPDPPQSARQEAGPGSGLPSAAATPADVAVPSGEVDVQTAATAPIEEEAGDAAPYSPTVEAAVADFIAAVAEDGPADAEHLAEDELHSFGVCSDAEPAIAPLEVEAISSAAQDAEAGEQAAAASPDADAHAASGSPEAVQAAAVPATEPKSASPPSTQQSVSPVPSAGVAEIAAVAISEDEQSACSAGPAEAAAHASTPVEAMVQVAAHGVEDTAAVDDVPAPVGGDTALPEEPVGNGAETQPCDTADAEVDAAPRASLAQPISSPAAAEEDVEVDLGSPALPDAAPAQAAIAEPSPHAAMCLAVAEELPAADDAPAAVSPEVSETVSGPLIRACAYKSPTSW